MSLSSLVLSSLPLGVFATISLPCLAHVPCPVCVLSRVRLFETLWTIAHQAPLSMKFSRQEYWSGLSFLSPGDLPNPGIEPSSLACPALADRFFATVPRGKPRLSQSLSMSLPRILFPLLPWLLYHSPGP